jgi:DNA (cytosine-5)-methyltransferase 1
MFSGPQRAICQQIGNAVPPLLGFQIAAALGRAGDMVDVFAGAGGLSLGFKWKGWRSLAATDIDRHSVDTFNRNVSPVAFVGDMWSNEVLDRLVGTAPPPSERVRPLALVGGPPCQGFSTGGNRRSELDERNGLYVRYAALLERLRPDIFIFENVLGLLSMAKGAFLPRVTEALKSVGYEIDIWRINAAEFGLPQRRKRLIIVGVPCGRPLPKGLVPWRSPTESGSAQLPLTVTVSEAVGDLPILSAGQDGSELEYCSQPRHLYQQFLRGHIDAPEFLSLLPEVIDRAAA